MSYKRYIINKSDSLNIRSNADGFQPKFLVDNGTKFIKVQCELQRTLRDDWRVEDIASRICTQLSIYAVKQAPCNVRINYDNGRYKDRLGVISDNFEQHGLSYISFNSLVESKNAGNLLDNFNKINTRQKLNNLINITSKLSGIALQYLVKYFFDMITVDLLVANQDRHFGNFGVFWNNNTCAYDIAMLFDFGMGLFENDTYFDRLDSLNDCMKNTYIAPYGEDPFDMIQILKDIPQYRIYLKSLDIQKLKLDKSLFIHSCAYEYFSKIRKELIDVSKL